MNLETSWIIAAKDPKVIMRKRSIRYTLVVLPVLLAILFPLVIRFVLNKGTVIPAPVLTGLLNAFSFFFVIVAALIPTPIASYSIVGEKVEKSLEPLLATPYYRWGDSAWKEHRSVSAIDHRDLCGRHDLHDSYRQRNLQHARLPLLSKLDHRYHASVSRTPGRSSKCRAQHSRIRKG